MEDFKIKAHTLRCISMTGCDVCTLRRGVGSLRQHLTSSRSPFFFNEASSDWQSEGGQSDGVRGAGRDHRFHAKKKKTGARSAKELAADAEHNTHSLKSDLQKEGICKCKKGPESIILLLRLNFSNNCGRCIAYLNCTRLHGGCCWRGAPRVNTTAKVNLAKVCHFALSDIIWKFKWTCSCGSF